MDLLSSVAFALPSVASGFSNAHSTGKCPTTRPRRVLVECRRGGSNRAKERRRGDMRRPNRIGELLYRGITPIVEDAFANVFEDEAEADKPVVVSVEGVTCSPDLRNARVRVNVLGNAEQKKQVLRWLKESRKSLRHELAQCVRMKYVPELSFGESEESSVTRTVNILDRLAHERAEKLKLGIGVDLPSATTAVTTTTGEEAILAGDDDEEDRITPSYMQQKEFEFEDLDEDENIVEVDENDEDLADMDDDQFRAYIYNTLKNSNESAKT